ncbi:MAG: hypothetical protein RL375_1632, partial [Pseudomonadota bacterium]
HLVARRSSARIRPGDQSVNPASSIEQYLNNLGSRPPDRPIERDTSAPSASAASALAFDTTDLMASAVSTPEQPSRTPDTLPEPPSAQVNRWAQAEFGPPSLDHRRIRVHRNDIDKAIGDGYLGFALVMLEQLLHSGEGKHPWVLMRLLDVYRQLRQQDNHERVCAEIEALYCVRVPNYGDEPTDAATSDSIDTLTNWPALRAAWASDNPSPLIATSLLRGGHQVAWDLQTFADLLFLHELAETREAIQDAGALPA